MNKKQYNNVIEHTLKLEQCEDSLGTARAVFNNMGVALPQGDLSQVKETLETNDYMGWQSCTMEEAQAAADSGVAAIGISDERIVVLSANDEEQPVAATASVMSISENTTEIASYGMDYYVYNNMTTVLPEMPAVKERVTIVNDTYFNTVIFGDSRKSWLCVNHDVIYGSVKQYILDRAKFNICPDPRVDPIKTYTDEEIKLLYAIDPYGVAYYVSEYAYIYAEENYDRNIDKDHLRKQIEYKDYIFELLYGRAPKYYDRDTDGNFHLTLSRDLDEVFSESETIFGMHPLNDEITKQALAQMAISIIGLAIGGVAEVFGNVVTKAIDLAYKATVQVISIGEAIVTNSLMSYAASYIEDKLDFANIGWANELIERYSSFMELVGYFSYAHEFERETANYCATNTNFDVYVETLSGATYSLQEILDSIEDV